MKLARLSIPVVFLVACSAAPDAPPSRPAVTSAPVASSPVAPPAPSAVPSASAEPVASASVSAVAAAPPAPTCCLLSPPKPEDLAGPCTASAAETIGVSDVKDGGDGPHVSVAASALGVVAAWESTAESLQVRRLGQPAGEATTIPAELRAEGPSLWPLQAGNFLLLYSPLPKVDTLMNSAFRVIAIDGKPEQKILKSPFSFSLKMEDAVGPRGPVVLTRSSGDSRGVIEIDAAQGLTATATAVPAPSDKDVRTKDPALFIDGQGRYVVVTQTAKDKVAVDVKGLARQEVSVEADFLALQPRVRLGADGAVVLTACGTKDRPSRRIVDGKVESAAGEAASCALPWRLDHNISTYDMKDHHLGFFTGKGDPLVIEKVTRSQWRASAAWTGDGFIVVYAKPEGARWNVLSRKVRCKP